jgi:hypothetical protein
MKHYLFLYRADRTSHSDPYYAYTNLLSVEEAAFPAGTPD